MEKSKLASEKYKNSSDEEEGTINQYADSIKNYDTKIATTRDANQAGNPTGTIIAYSVDKAPEGYLKCEGQAVSRNDYKNLFNVIGTTYGEGDGSTTFNVPDLRGEFLRGTGTNSHTNQGSGATVGIHQDSTEIPALYVGPSGKLFAATYEGCFFGSYGNPDYVYNVNASFAGGSIGSKEGYGFEAYRTIRPTNTSVLYCIKY